MSHQNFLTLLDLAPETLRGLVTRAIELKKILHDGALHEPLKHRILAMVFEKESLRTRFTFDIGMQDLGGSATFLDLSNGARMGARESVRDMAKNLERWTHAIVARTYRHRTVVELAQTADVPVVNGLSELLHPCQALADTMTLIEHWGEVKGRKLVFIGDGNNTCHSLITAATKLGMDVVVCAPEGYEPDAELERLCSMLVRAYDPCISCSVH